MTNKQFRARVLASSFWNEHSQVGLVVKICGSFFMSQNQETINDREANKYLGISDSTKNRETLSSTSVFTLNTFLLPKPSEDSRTV